MPFVTAVVALHRLQASVTVAPIDNPDGIGGGKGTQSSVTYESRSLRDGNEGVGKGSASGNDV